MENKSLIIVPCFNEANRIQKDSYLNFLNSNHAQAIQLLFVDDGSTDATTSILTELVEASDKATLLKLEKNVGKAEAIRSGVLNTDLSSFEYIGYWDADLASPLEEISRLIEFSKKYKPEALMIIGSRIKILGLTDIKRKLRRHYIGRIFATIVSNMLRLPIYDTQCGAKILRSEAVEPLFNESFSSKWLFDVELIFRLKASFENAHDRILEVPLKEWRDQKGSKISYFYYLQATFDLLRIFFRYK